MFSRLSKFITLLIWLLVGAVAAYFIMRLFAAPGMPPQQLNVAGSAVPTLSEEDLINFFDGGRKKSGEIKAQPTKLDLKLLGVIFSSPQTGGKRLALIQTADGKEIPFREGDVIAERYKLQRIEAGRIYLTNNHRDDQASQSELMLELKPDAEVEKLLQQATVVSP